MSEMQARARAAQLLSLKARVRFHHNWLTKSVSVCRSSIYVGVVVWFWGLMDLGRCCFSNVNANKTQIVQKLRCAGVFCLLSAHLGVKN
jgi:hypothetical protein